MSQTDFPLDDDSAQRLIYFLQAGFQDGWNYAHDATFEDGNWRAERTVLVLDGGAEIPNAYMPTFRLYGPL